MCLAEALLRVPDADTTDDLIQDKLANKDWSAHLGESESFFVNASTWGLMLTGKVVSLEQSTVQSPGNYLGKLIARSGEPIIRTAVRQAMRVMGKQFVLAENIEQAMKTSKTKQSQGFTYSYDMLGEAARTSDDADRYMKAYETAIRVIGTHCTTSDPIANPGISVKLSALHPRYEYRQANRITLELLPKLKQLCLQAKEVGIGLTIDAEESERLDPSLTLLEEICGDPDLQDWSGLGFVVQAYQKRAPFVIDWIQSLVRKSGRRIMIRLVKGAYWDTEIKQAQLEGYSGYPVYTRKVSTDLSYLVCAQKLLASPDSFYPLFATHNAHTVASVLSMAKGRRDSEFQCLHGMGNILYDEVVSHYGVRCRIYAPVGPHKDLLAYLVRRLLENGANSSFVNRLVDNELPIERVIRDPIQIILSLNEKPHPKIPLPCNIFPDRENSSGINLNSEIELGTYYQSARELAKTDYQIASLVANTSSLEHSQKHSSTHPKPHPEKHPVPQGKDIPVINPCNGRPIGILTPLQTGTIEKTIDFAVEKARKNAKHWNQMGGKARATILRLAADNYQKHHEELLTLCLNESGKTLDDGIAELREAIDFLRYYALLAEREFTPPINLDGPTGELNQLSLHGRGIFVCISPWNFPLAIFTGQVGAALAAGNAVIAKPAEQTPIIAYRAVQILHESGVPESILQLLLGDGPSIGAALVSHPNIDGVAFTGSTRTAQTIHRALAQKEGPIIPLIAETGGINAMIVDSTALPEQVVRDTIRSAFQSAGQRCSALRVLYIQEEVADQMIQMLLGAMAELKIGDVTEASTDIGPIIDLAARDNLIKHIQKFTDSGSPVTTGPPIQGDKNGYFLSPTVIEIEGIGELEQEVFGPILHVCRFASSDLDKVIDDINASGYGLTFGIHSRVQSTVDRVINRIEVGNIYVNRNTIGAVVGVQPFGGEGLSGTGPKAGGPRYLHRFALERSISTDTTAAGGNTSLLSLESL